MFESCLCALFAKIDIANAQSVEVSAFEDSKSFDSAVSASKIVLLHKASTKYVEKINFSNFAKKLLT